MSISRFTKGMSCVGVMGLAVGTAWGQNYPNKPIHIVTTAAGGGGDFTARQLAQGISGPLGQPVIVENRPSTFVAAENVYKAPPDGHTLIVVGSTFWVLRLSFWVLRTSFQVLGSSIVVLRFPFYVQRNKGVKQC